MRTLRPTLAALALLLPLALAAAPRAGASEVRTSAKGMTYSIRVPQGYDPAEGALLVVCLHGQGGSHASFLRQVEPAPFLARAILVAPNASANAAWEEGDIDLVGDLVLEVRARYRVFRTLAFGFSRGAFMGFGLGLRRPDAVQGVIAHSGGLVVPVPDAPGAKAQIFAVIHGDQDGTVPVQSSQDAVKALQGAGVTAVRYDELKGLGHTVDAKAVERALAWVEEQNDARAKERVAALEKAAKGKDASTLTGALDALEACGKALTAKAQALAAKALGSSDDAVAKAAAAALARVGGDAAIAALVKALPALESKKRADVIAACDAALAALTGEKLSGAKEWKKWAATPRRA